jgi:hypothetical protein
MNKEDCFITNQFWYIPNVIQKLVLAKLAPRILIRRSRRTNSSLLEIGGYFCGLKG